MPKQASALALVTTTRPASLGVAALEQFLRNLRNLQEIFKLPAVCERELVLRSEMRKTMTELALALTEAADDEPIVKLAGMYRNAAIEAARLAAHGPCRRSGN